MNAIFEGSVDFEGQRVSQRIAELLILVGTVLSYTVGYSTSSVFNSFIAFGGTIVLAALICVPPWPAYNKHPVKFLAPLKAGKTE
ncbi:MAG: microsomal signal peptidase 12kDa subunit [Piptocephalis tieghemiana]|nr:MAG: microsomal signal peptidase 12kDa subunit [Piptocephalis tieghemiana]